MFEFLFYMTVVYMAYVAYEAYQTVGRAERGEPVFKSASAEKPASVLEPAAAVKSDAPQPAAAPDKPASTLAKEAESDALADELRNPLTGEVSSVPPNYRFAKKWIKDALVNEKLLDRVYKPSELDDVTTRKVKEAIDKLRAIKKYQA